MKEILLTSMDNTVLQELLNFYKSEYNMVNAIGSNIMGTVTTAWVLVGLFATIGGILLTFFIYKKIACKKLLAKYQWQSPDVNVEIQQLQIERLKERSKSYIWGIVVASVLLFSCILFIALANLVYVDSRPIFARMASLEQTIKQLEAYM